MRIRRTILTHVILAISTTGALIAGPAFALTATAAPVSAVAAAHPTPNIIVMHG